MGHVAVALAAKRVRPSLPLWVLALATVFLDEVNAVLRLVTLEEPARWTHTLAGAVSLSLAAGAIGLALWGAQAGAWLGALTASHLPLDLVTGLRALWPLGPLVGLGLYGVRAADFTVEVVLIIASWLVYRRTLQPPARQTWPCWAILLLLLSCQAAFDFGAFAVSARVGIR
jgi:hypothetical protein